MTPNHPKWRFIVPPFKKLGQTPLQRGGVPWKTLLLLVFWGSPGPLLGAIFTVIPFKNIVFNDQMTIFEWFYNENDPLRVNFHCNTIQNIVFNDQMIIFEWFYNENDPLGGSIFTVMPFKNIVFNNQRPFFEWCYNENDPPPGGQKWPLLGGGPPFNGSIDPQKTSKTNDFWELPK